MRSVMLQALALSPTSAFMLPSSAALHTPTLPSRSSALTASAAEPGFDRRAVLGLGVALSALLPGPASAIVESSNPASNYYFPMAKYRYLPRIFRAWVALDQLAPAALEVGDWEGLEEVWKRADDAVTALPLYTNAVEGSRSGKRKKKSPLQKSMIVDLKGYSTALDDLKVAVAKKNTQKAQASLAAARESLLAYRTKAQIDSEDGGVISLPLGNAEESGHAGAPLGYVVPAFRGGGVSMDYALRPGEPMMQGGVIRSDYRNKYQDTDGNNVGPSTKKK